MVEGVRCSVRGAVLKNEGCGMRDLPSGDAFRSTVRCSLTPIRSWRASLRWKQPPNDLVGSWKRRTRWPLVKGVRGKSLGFWVSGPGSRVQGLGCGVRGRSVREEGPRQERHLLLHPAPGASSGRLPATPVNSRQRGVPVASRAPHDPDLILASLPGMETSTSMAPGVGGQG